MCHRFQRGFTRHSIPLGSPSCLDLLPVSTTKRYISVMLLDVRESVVPSYRLETALSCTLQSSVKSSSHCRLGVNRSEVSAGCIQFEILPNWGNNTPFSPKEKVYSLTSLLRCRGEMVPAPLFVQAMTHRHCHLASILHSLSRRSTL